MGTKYHQYIGATSDGKFTVACYAPNQARKFLRDELLTAERNAHGDFETVAKTDENGAQLTGSVTHEHIEVDFEEDGLRRGLQRVRVDPAGKPLPGQELAKVAHYKVEKNADGKWVLVSAATPHTAEASAEQAIDATEKKLADLKAKIAKTKK